jgi:hypothetical protein
MERLSNEHLNLYGKYITYKQLCTLTNLGMSSARKLANESGAVVHIGRSARINIEKVFNHIEGVSAE